MGSVVLLLSLSPILVVLPSRPRPSSVIPCPVPRRRLLVLTLQAVARGSGGRSLGVVGVIIFVVIWPEGVSESGYTRMGAYLAVFPIHGSHGTSLSQSSPKRTHRGSPSHAVGC
jgi:hypothetical protein